MYFDSFSTSQSSRPNAHGNLRGGRNYRHSKTLPFSFTERKITSKRSQRDGQLKEER